jgi:succinylglutamate desuccinylase
MPDVLEQIRKLNPEKLKIEDKECLELLETIETERKNYQPTLTLILDLHTTTADGGIFTIAPEGDFNRIVAKGLHVPVVLGIAERLTGTTIEYFQQPSLNCYCIGFEAGQHVDPEGVHRSVAAIVNCMRSIGSIDPGEVDHKHDGLLIRLSIGLPKVTRLIYHYSIRPEEHFFMNPGYENFQRVKKGEELARNENGPVLAASDGLILMPKYQSQGDDGFFIVEVVEN